MGIWLGEIDDRNMARTYGCVIPPPGCPSEVDDIHFLKGREFVVE
jgi:hypothetical protein